MTIHRIRTNASLHFIAIFTHFIRHAGWLFCNRCRIIRCGPHPYYIRGLLNCINFVCLILTLWTQTFSSSLSHYSFTYSFIYNGVLLVENPCCYCAPRSPTTRDSVCLFFFNMSINHAGEYNETKSLIFPFSVNCIQSVFSFMQCNGMCIWIFGFLCVWELEKCCYFFSLHS